MKTTLNTAGFPLVIMILWFGSPAAQAQQGRPSVPRPPHVPFEVIDKGSVGAPQQKGELVIRNEQQWADLWRDLHGQRSSRPAPPVIDFEKEMILAVLMGQQPTGGYAIEVTQIVTLSGQVIVKVLQTAPSEGTPVTLMLSSPYCIVKLGRIDKPVRFEVPALKKSESSPDDEDVWREATSASGQAEVVAEVQEMYADLSARNWKKFAEHFGPGAIISTAADENGSKGLRILNVTDWIAEARLGLEGRDSFDEKMMHQEVHTFNNVAQVWSHFVAHSKDKGKSETRSGIDAITLHKNAGRWKIAALGYSSRE